MHGYLEIDNMFLQLTSDVGATNGLSRGSHLTTLSVVLSSLGLCHPFRAEKVIFRLLFSFPLTPLSFFCKLTRVFCLFVSNM